jgi:hypothetical protein
VGVRPPSVSKEARADERFWDLQLSTWRWMGDSSSMRRPNTRSYNSARSLGSAAFRHAFRRASSFSCSHQGGTAPQSRASRRGPQRSTAVRQQRPSADVDRGRGSVANQIEPGREGRKTFLAHDGLPPSHCSSPRVPVRGGRGIALGGTEARDSGSKVPALMSPGGRWAATALPGRSGP